MKFTIEKTARTGFCFGVNRAIDILTKATAERGSVETLGAIVHNHQVMQSLAALGVTVASGLDKIRGNVVAIGSHGVSPEVEAEMRSRFSVVIDTTCPFVHRAQLTARRLANAGFYVVVYGEANHPEVRGILGYAQGKGLATMDEAFIKSIAAMKPQPRRLGILSQTTQIPDAFTDFARKAIDSLLTKDAELRFIDTICHDIRERQQEALELARRVGLMLIVGSHTSANTNHLADLCATVTSSHLIENAEALNPAWLTDCTTVGVTSGASTAEETIEAVVARLEALRRR